MQKNNRFIHCNLCIFPNKTLKFEGKNLEFYFMLLNKVSGFEHICQN